MTEPEEPKDLEDMKMEDVAPEEPESETRTFLNNISGTVFRAHRFGIYVSFQHEDKNEIGVLFPGKSFVNATNLLGDIVKTDQELGLLFPPGMPVCVDLVSQLRRLVPESGSSLGRESDKTEERKCGWVIMTLWLGDMAGKPDPTSLNDGTSFQSQNEGFRRRLDWIASQVLLENPAVPEPLCTTDNWFVNTIVMPRPTVALAHPDVASTQGAVGSIQAIHRPHGGVVEVKRGDVTTTVFFHRSRVYLDGVHLSVTEDLGKILLPGMVVRVDYSPNETEDGPFFEDCPSPNVAFLVYTGQRPQIPDIRYKTFPLTEDENNKYLVAQIISLDPPGPTGVESGIAKIIKPTDQNTLAFTKNSFKRYVDVDSPVKLVRFHRSKIFHLGALQHKADLQYFFSSCAFGMNIFYCYATPVARKADSWRFKDEVVEHEVTLGWKGSVSFLHATGQGGLTLTPNTREDTLLYPRVFSFQSTKFLGREGMDIKTYEDIVEGHIPARGTYLNGFASVEGASGAVSARIHDILPPPSNSGVSTGVVYVETGPYAGLKAYFDRSVCTAFGWSLEKSDLQYVIDLNEACFVKLEEGREQEGGEIKLEVKALWIGWPPEYNSFKEPHEIPDQFRHKFLLFLEAHNLTIKDFVHVIHGEKTPRQFIPFRKDEMKGTVVRLDRGTKARVGFQNQQAKDMNRIHRDIGAVSGVIKVDKGPLIGTLVTFHRRNTWVLGYNMGKADLTHLFIEGQKVSLEAVEISADDRRKYTGLPYEYKHRATLVWTSKFRPRNDIDKTVPESIHVNNWLRKRGLTWERFQQLIKGKLPIVPPQISCRHKSNMLRGGELEMMLGPLESAPGINGDKPEDRQQQRLDEMPVYRHGPEATRICEESLSMTGPTDPRIFNIIRSDNNAQMAFHIHKALGYALEEYIKVTGRGMPAYSYSGFGDVFGSTGTSPIPAPQGQGGGGGPGPVWPAPPQSGSRWQGQPPQGGSGAGWQGGMVNPPSWGDPAPQSGSGGGGGWQGQPPQGGSGGGWQGGRPNHQMGGGSYQQANQMANRLQQMAMDGEGERQGGGARRGPFGGSYGEGMSSPGGGGQKRQMNNQGGSRGKKNKGGWVQYGMNR